VASGSGADDDWFAGMELSGSGEAAEEAAASDKGEPGDWFGPERAPASGEKPGPASEPKEWFGRAVPVQRAASGSEQGGEWFGASPGTGQPAAGSEPVAGWSAGTSGEVPGRAGMSGSEPVGRVAGSPGEMQGSPGVTRDATGQLRYEGQGSGMPQGEWSAGPAQPAPQDWSGGHTPPTGQPRPNQEFGRLPDSTSERVLYGSAAGPMPGGPGGTPPGGHYLIRPGQPPPPSPQPQRSGRAMVVGAIAALLLIGGGAGALGGYLVAGSNSGNAPVTNALDQPPADQTSSTAAPGTVEAVAEKVSPSVVQLQVQGRQAAGEGSGFIVRSDGLIITNNHVVEVAADNGQIRAVFADGSTAPAKIVGRDPTSDVAVVQAEGKSGLPVVDLGSSEALKVGQGVVAIGSPFELSGTVTTGIVSSLHRPTRAGGEDGSQATVMDAIQTDAAINPGNSGGPLVNMQGQVIGINSAIYSPQSSAGAQGGSVGIGFAIPMDQARRTADEIAKTGKATQTILGVSVRDNENGGALIVEVTPGGPGEQAGLKSGDVVTKLDDRRIDTSDALVAAVRSNAPGDKVRLELSNGSRTVEATLAGQTVETE
jgi:putative serine protease PepD